ncbi:hypothetical protein DSECCO2_635540 [anaerobic digester metagenome]
MNHLLNNSGAFMTRNKSLQASCLILVHLIDRQRKVLFLQRLKQVVFQFDASNELAIDDKALGKGLDLFRSIIVQIRPVRILILWFPAHRVDLAAAMFRMFRTSFCTVRQPAGRTQFDLFIDKPLGSRYFLRF